MANTSRGRKRVTASAIGKKKGGTSVPDDTAGVTTKPNAGEKTSEPQISHLPSDVTRVTRSGKIAAPLGQTQAFPKAYAAIAAYRNTQYNSSSSEDYTAKPLANTFGFGPPIKSNTKNKTGNNKIADKDDNDDEDEDADDDDDNNKNKNNSGADDDEDDGKEDANENQDDDDYETDEDDDDDLDSDIEMMCKSVTMSKKLSDDRKKSGRKSTTKQSDYRADYDRQRKIDAASGDVTCTSFTGDCTKTIRPMVEVETSPLRKNHTFPEKNILLIRIAEETNLRGIRTHAVKSNPMILHVRGYKFVVRANFSPSKGWNCTRVQCREGDFVATDDDKKFTDEDTEQFFDCDDDEKDDGVEDEDEEHDDEDDADNAKGMSMCL